VITVLAFILGYFVNHIAYDDAYTEAFKAAAGTIASTAREVGETKANAQKQLEQIAAVTADSLLAAKKIDEQKKLVDDILAQHTDRIVDALVHSPGSEKLLQGLGQKELLDVRSDINSIRTQLNTLTLTFSAFTEFAPLSFTRNSCKGGKELGVLFALHDSNVPNPSSMGFLLTGGPNAAGYTNHDWAQLHVCQWTGGTSAG
jgi:hypothetical protein